MAASVRDSINGIGSGSSISVASTGLTFVTGDLLVLHVWGYTTVGAPSGGNTTWTERLTGNYAEAFGGTMTHRVYSGVAGATITAFTLSNGASDTWAWTLTAVQGADTTTVVDGTAAVASGAFGGDPTAPSIADLAGTDSLLLCGASAMANDDPNYTFTAPDGMSELEDFESFYGFSLAAQALSGSGATGTKAFTESPAEDSGRWMASSIAIKSASGGVSIEVPAGSLTAAGLAATVLLSGAISITVPAGALAATGHAPTVTVNTHTTITVPAGALTATGQFASVAFGGPGAGVLTATGYAPTVSLTDLQTVAPGAGSLTATGLAPVVSVVTPGTMEPGVGSLTVTGQAPSLGFSWVITPPAGSLVFQGRAPGDGSLSANRSMQQRGRGRGR